MTTSETSRPFTAAIIGAGDMASGLLTQLLNRSELIQPKYLVGNDPTSQMLKRASDLGIHVSAEGVDWLFSLPETARPDFVFETVSASAHAANAQRYREADIHVIDLTSEAVGPYVCPSVNLDTLDNAFNVNMITSGGQATIPIVAAVSAVVPVDYAEVVVSISSRSVGPESRANVDKFVETTTQALESVGGAKHGKAIIVLNPADPPVMMRNTIFVGIPAEAAIEGKLQNSIRESIKIMVEKIQDYALGFELTAEPQFEEARPEWNGLGRVTVLVQIKGTSDFFPAYAGDLDIVTSAATRTADCLAVKLLAMQDA